ncbi:DEAD/DEAH box helicase family protein [bacterium]|nr:DEAD/DEAH box helicase family protein [bacterium]
MILPKKEMSEEDVKLNFITPSLLAKGWKNKITMESEVRFTDGRINTGGNVASRGPAKRADYILYINANNPIAVVEAKDNRHSVSFGMQQAKEYAGMMKIPFAYSSNGDAFQEYDFFTGKERQLPLDAFPTPEDLYRRFKEEVNGGQGLSEPEEEIIKQPYYSGQNTNTPRYYQRNAINLTLRAVARGQKRMLLVMATGTGKTFVAFQIVYRLLRSGLKRKILYLADRNILVDQSIQQDFSPLAKTVHKVDFSKDDPTTVSSYEVYFSLYQQLDGKSSDNEGDDEEAVAKFKKLFSPDFFDFIIVDECHRGSAKRDGRWRRILEYFSSAAQLGMTATPKETKYISNVDYFGAPIYTYSLNEGISDGFLAPFKVINVKTDIGDGWRPCKGQLDFFGHEIEDRIYSNKDYDYNIVIEDRINKVAAEITGFLKRTDRMAKTIVFCATEDHAERMRAALTNLNADMCSKNPDYVVRITGSDSYGKSKLDYFISLAPYPVIATTSKLLTTGADCKMTKLIAIDQNIGSMTEFKQIIGRGTRIREKEGKTHFTVMDFRDVSRLFADPAWDGEIETDEDYDPAGQGQNGAANSGAEIDSDVGYGTEGGAGRELPYVDVDGCPVKIIDMKVSVYGPDGKLLRSESVADYTRRNILSEFASLDIFTAYWQKLDKKSEICVKFRERGIDLEALKKESNLSETDDFDFILFLAYEQRPLTRRERADKLKKRDFLSKYSGKALEVLNALLDTYIELGIYEIEKTEILNLSPFRIFGKPPKIAGLFGGRDGYLAALRGLEKELYRVD